jgi:hypothetical protein
MSSPCIWVWPGQERQEGRECGAGEGCGRAREWDGSRGLAKAGNAAGDLTVVGNLSQQRGGGSLRGVLDCYSRPVWDDGIGGGTEEDIDEHLVPAGWRIRCSQARVGDAGWHSGWHGGRAEQDYQPVSVLGVPSKPKIMAWQPAGHAQQAPG